MTDDAVVEELEARLALVEKDRDAWERSAAAFRANAERDHAALLAATEERDALAERLEDAKKRQRGAEFARDRDRWEAAKAFLSLRQERDDACARADDLKTALADAKGALEMYAASALERNAALDRAETRLREVEAMAKDAIEQLAPGYLASAFAHRILAVVRGMPWP